MRITFIVCLLISNLEWSQTPAKQPLKNKQKTTSSSSPKAEDLNLGKQLMTNSDCDACHQLEGTLIGPALKDIAKKYPSNETNILYLANKIRNGGSGVWGETEMAPHSSFTLEETKKIALYVLSLK